MRRVAVACALVLGAGACGGDDGTGVRTIDGTGSESGSASSTGGSGPGSGSAATAACVPVGEGGGTGVTVGLAEWSVTPEPAEVEAGDVTFTADNLGADVHELVVVAADSPDDLTVVDGQVDEEALPEGAFIGEIEGFPAGETCEGTFALPAGEYVLFCNILENEPDGTVESHYEEGMVAEFSVG